MLLKRDQNIKRINLALKLAITPDDDGGAYEHFGHAQ
jgi:hypothetical protein